MKAVAFFTDHHMLPGLHVAVSSLLDSLGGDGGRGLTLYVFLDRVGARDQELLRQTHGRNPKGTQLVLRDFSPSAPEGGNALHGNRTAYGRIHLPELLVDCERCVYLDCDLFVNRPVDELFDLFDSQHVLLVDGTVPRKYTLEKGLFLKAGIDLERPGFNSGVMGMDLGLWRKRGLTPLLEETARQYRGLFTSADQALLNVALHDSFKEVGETWNTVLYPSTPTLTGTEARIYHFVGSPKPWDLFGKHLHNNHALWRRQFLQTAIGHHSPLRYSSLKRNVATSRQMFVSLRRVLRF